MRSAGADNVRKLWDACIALLGVTRHCQYDFHARGGAAIVDGVVEWATRYVSHSDGISTWFSRDAQCSIERLQQQLVCKRCTDDFCIDGGTVFPGRAANRFTFSGVEFYAADPVCLKK